MSGRSQFGTWDLSEPQGRSGAIRNLLANAELTEDILLERAHQFWEWLCNRPILSNPGWIRTFEQFAGYVLQDRALIQSYLDRVSR